MHLPASGLQAQPDVALCRQRYVAMVQTWVGACTTDQRCHGPTPSFQTSIRAQLTMHKRMSTETAWRTASRSSSCRQTLCLAACRWTPVRCTCAPQPSFALPCLAHRKAPRPRRSRYDFVMCNPPFYASEDDIDARGQQKGAPPTSVCGSRRTIRTPSRRLTPCGALVHTGRAGVPGLGQ